MLKENLNESQNVELVSTQAVCIETDASEEEEVNDSECKPPSSVQKSMAW